MPDTRFYFVTLAYRYSGDSEWGEQNDILDVHPLEYLRQNNAATDRAVKAYRDFQASGGPNGSGVWAGPARGCEYVLRFWAEITHEEYERHQAWENGDE